MPTLHTSTADVKAEVERFLSTDNPQEEAQILRRLRNDGVSTDLVKPLLRDIAHQRKPAKSGLQLGLQTIVHGKNFPYALYVPSGGPADAIYPMIVVLHGAGASGDSIIPSWVERLSQEFIVLCPSYPAAAWWTSTAETLVLDLIHEVKKKYPVDPQRVFLSGLSNGAIGTYMTGMFHPDIFAGIVPIAGTITPRYMHFLVNLINTPTYIIQGVHDPIFPIALSRRVNKILTDMNYPTVYREHEEKGSAHGGHFLPESEIAPMARWLNKQKRVSLPEKVRMTREENHMGRIHWARLSKGDRLAALALPGPQGEPANVKNGKIATLMAVRKEDNQFEIQGKNLLQFELYLNNEMVDFSEPITITTQEIFDQGDKLVHGEKVLRVNQVVRKDLEVLLRGFKEYQDPDFLFDAMVVVSTEQTLARVFTP